MDISITTKCADGRTLFWHIVPAPWKKRRNFLRSLSAGVLPSEVGLLVRFKGFCLSLFDFEIDSIAFEAVF